MKKRKAVKCTSRITAPTVGTATSTPSLRETEHCVISSSYQLEDHGNCVVTTVLSDAGGQSDIKRVFTMRIPPNVSIAKAVAFLIDNAFVESQRLGYKHCHGGFFHADGTVGHTFSVST